MRVQKYFFKAVFLSLFGLMLCMVPYAQNSVSLVFTGIDQHNRYVRINSVTIENLTRGWSETILFPDTVYTLNIGTGIEESVQEKGMQVMPNPFDGNTRVNIFASKSETVKMLLVDINGKKCAEYNGTLIAGDNLFDISLTTPQIYILQVISMNGTRSLKMVNKGHAGSDRIMSAGNVEKTAKIDLKSTSVQSFELGDEMRYTGYTYNQGLQLQSEVITQAQFVSEELQLRFNIVSTNILTVTTDSVWFNNTNVYCNGTVVSGAGVTERGFCWSISPHPTLANDYTLEGNGSGSFSSILEGLNPHQYYFLRAFASTNEGTVYGNEFRFRLTNSYLVTDTVFLPDGVDCGNGCAYISSVETSGFSDSETLQSANDILYVRAKIEHSFIGDLYMELICPPDPVTGERRSAIILKKYGNSSSTQCSNYIPSNGWGWNVTSGIASGTDFGAALHSDEGDKCNPATNPMGTPWNYCWSNNTANCYQYANGQGYVYETVNQGHHLSGSVDSSDMANMTNIYHPDESFASLIGCPMNGIWSINIIDAWYGDNGYITEWELAFDDFYETTMPVLPELATACPGVTSVTDYDGNEYHTVQIGNQCWMRENLRTTHYATGEAISMSNAVDPSNAHYYLPDVPDSMGTYGYLYNWKAVVGASSGSAANPSGVQGICPPGWHVPSEAEWTQLTNYMSGLGAYVCDDNPVNIAKALAAADSSWSSSANPCAVGYDLQENNTSGFSALPAGLAYGLSVQSGTDATFWTSTSYNDIYAHYHALNFDHGYMEQNSFGNKANGMSVRCILAEAPKVNTSATINNIMDTAATGGGEVISIGGAPVTERGLCWSTHTYPTIADDHLACGAGLGSFTGQMTGLIPSTTYYVRAYATNAAGTVYGTQISFTTFDLPVVESYDVTNILDSTATCGGNVLSDGGVPVTARGVCWSTSVEPSIANSHTTDGAGLGEFTSQLTGLTPGTLYYLRAYATNNFGTAYGIQKTFTTKNVPTVTLDSATNILSITASCRYHVIADGGMTVTNRGICYSTNPNPTLNDIVIASTDTAGTIQLSGLTPGTTYYVRAFATNSVGTAYSSQISFTTLTIPTVTTAAIIDISFFTATGGGEVLATGVPEITARGICWSTSNNPTIADNHTIDSAGFGTFTSMMTGLNLHTIYYVRAYATNSSGTGYGNQVTFMTLNIPTVNTISVTDIWDSTATCRGNVTSDGGGVLLAKGICWSTSQNPTIDDNIITDTSAQTNYTCMMTGLIPGTTYYVRAFATNGGGTAYGAQRNFITKTIPTITLDSATNILSLTASCTYHITATGGMTIIDRGICYSTSPNPTLGNNAVTVIGTSNTGTVQLSGLTPGATYYVRAFAINGVGTAYSNQIAFTTLIIPTVTTTAASDISFFTATSGGEVLATGVPEITARGICWSTSANPTLADSHTSDSTGFGIFTSQITGLTINTTYYVRAYATNNFGTGYGNQVTFTTLNIPSVSTKAITNIMDSTATCGGNVTSNGGSTATLLAKGICWSTFLNPTIEDSIAIDTSSQNNYTCVMTGLIPNTTYYVRAFATNGGGTAYGVQKNFTTKAVPTIILDSATNISSLTASCTYHITSTGGMTVTARGICYGTTPNPNLSDSVITGTGNTGTKQLTGLTPGTTYYVRAFATNNIGTGYSNQISFTTLTIPTVTTAEISNITLLTATCGGEVLATGVPEITARGVCWSTLPNPTTADSHTTDGVGFGAFTSQMTGLNSGTTYYVRAYATNSSGIGYGNLITFTTLNLPTVLTNAVSNIMENTATCGGNITNNGGTNVIARGICWSTSPNPTLNDNFTTNGSGTGEFTTTLTGLTSGSTYYIRAYATNSFGTTYGEERKLITLSPCPGATSVMDIDSNVYPTIQIGNQCWMKENLRATRYADGTEITNSNMICKFHYYDFGCSPSYYQPYYESSSLYNWAAVMRNSYYGNQVVQGVCPTGWHVPSKTEWEQLIDYVSSQSAYWCDHNRNSIAKALASPTGWNGSSNNCAAGYNQNTNNATGFSAVPVCPNPYSYPRFDYPYIDDDDEWHSLGHRVSLWSWSSWYSETFYLENGVENIQFNGVEEGFYRPIRCLRDTNGVSSWLPVVTTLLTPIVTDTAVTVGGNVTDEGDDAVIAKGICWSTSHNPIVDDDCIIAGTGLGTFNGSLTNLQLGTIYYARAYATNRHGTAYGNEVKFVTPIDLSYGQTCPNTPTVTDADGNIYNTVLIGDQCWTRENIRTTHYADGSAIPTESYSVLNNDMSNYAIYGYLYNWTAVMNGASSSTGIPSGVQGICPNGWHVPSDNEWSKLTDFVGSQSNYLCDSNNTYIAKALAAMSGWDYFWTECSPGHNPSTNNTTGFYAYNSGMWSTTEYNSAIFLRSLSYSNAMVNRYCSGMTSGNSVRCVSNSMGSTYSLPTINTVAVSSVTSISASTGGNITSEGASAVIDKGLCWSTSPMPVITDSHSTNSSNMMTFSDVLTGLSPNTTYYVRAYATNSYGTGYGQQVTFTTLALPEVTTENNVTSITDTSAICGGNLISVGGGALVECGICWDTTHNPTIANNHVSSTSTGTGNFTVNLVGLMPATTYYVRAYATNTEGTAYGSEIFFTTPNSNDGLPCPNAVTITDIDGNIYNTVQIGSQCWMKENLRTTHYSDGEYICNFDFTPNYYYPTYYGFENIDIYGYLYNYLAVSYPNNLCPDGWHVPNSEEWTQLTNYVSSKSEYVCGNNTEDIAKALASTTGWEQSSATCAIGNNQSVNDTTGFSVLPAGASIYQNDFTYYSSNFTFGHSACFWSNLNSYPAVVVHLENSFSNVRVWDPINFNACSIRCVRN